MFCLGGSLGCACGCVGAWLAGTGCAPDNGPGAACPRNSPGEIRQMAPAKKNPSNARSVVGLAFMFHQPGRVQGALQTRLDVAVVMRTAGRGM
jgi:hypothetical protein